MMQLMFDLNPLNLILVVFTFWMVEINMLKNGKSQLSKAFVCQNTFFQVSLAITTSGPLKP